MLAPSLSLEEKLARVAEVLSQKERRFCESIVRPGTTIKDAAKKSRIQYGTALKWLRSNERVVEYINALNEKMSSEAIASAEELQAFWSRVVRGHQAGNMTDKLAASKMLGQSFGMFVEKREVAGTIRVVDETTPIPDDEDDVEG